MIAGHAKGSIKQESSLYRMNMTQQNKKDLNM